MKTIKKRKEGDRKMEVWRKIDNLKKAGLSYNQIAKKVGASKTTVRRWHLGENCATCKNELKIDKLMWDELQNPDKLTRNGIIRAKHEFKVGDRVNMDGSRRYWIVTDIDTSGPFPVYKMSPEDETNKNYYVIGDKELKKCSVRDVDKDESKHKVIVDTSPVFVNIDEEIKYFEGRIAELKAQKEKEKWQFTEDEKVILRNLDKKYNWVLREDNCLFIFEGCPTKYELAWDDLDSSGVELGGLNHLFKCIKENEGPCNFREFI